MKSDIAILAGGCFWGMQDLLRKPEGVVSTEVGYTGGRNDNPTYQYHPGHAEAVRVIYPEVAGDSCFARPATSAPVPAFFTAQVISQNAQALCLSIFDATLQEVQGTINHDLPACRSVD